MLDGQPLQDLASREEDDSISDQPSEVDDDQDEVIILDAFR